MTLDIYKVMKRKLLYTTMDLAILLNKDVQRSTYLLNNLNKIGIDLSDFEVVINEATDYIYPINEENEEKE